MADITVSVASGAGKNFPDGVRLADALAELVSGKKRKTILAATVNGHLVDLATPPILLHIGNKARKYADTVDCKGGAE